MSGESTGGETWRFLVGTTLDGTREDPRAENPESLPLGIKRPRKKISSLPDQAFWGLNIEQVVGLTY